jgi:hypothetical protein
MKSSGSGPDIVEVRDEDCVSGTTEKGRPGVADVAKPGRAVLVIPGRN